MWLWVVNGLVLLPALHPVLGDVYSSSFMVQHMVYGAISGLIFLRLHPEPYHER